MSTIYALLVGIDKYQSPVPPLDGCVNDMHAIRDFLIRRAQRNGLSLKLEVLENEAATRMNIVQKFEMHLGQAGPDDTAFFYYSGHGSQENAHEMFWKVESDDKKNETLVCYDSRQFDGMDLADKELATLISVVAEKNPHILIITDCCNSGENTRSVGLEENEVKVRQSPAYTKERGLDSYILPRQVNSRDVSFETGFEEHVLVPESRHVHLAATHSAQLAKETFLGGSPRGVFTYSLLEVLENAVGPLTYSDVMRQVQSLVKNRTFDQNPQMYTLISGDDDLEFLNGSVKLDSHYYALSHTRETGWTIDAGSIHGLVPSNGSRGELSLLNVFAQDADEAEMQNADNALGQVSISGVSANTSNVRPEGDLQLDKKRVYRCRIHSMPVRQLEIHIRGEKEGVKLAEEALTKDPEANVFLKTVKRKEAEYHLIANKKGEYVIIRGTDADDQPLVEQIVGFNSEQAKKAIQNLEHIARWERVRDLGNPNSHIFNEAIRIDLFPPDGNQPLLPGSEGMVLNWNPSGSPPQIPRFRAKIVNTSGRDLYCALLYLSPEFEINAGLLHNKGIWLKNGEEAWAIEGKSFAGSIPKVFLDFGKNEVQSFLKLIVSTQDFNAGLMEQGALGLPQNRTRSIGENPKSRSLMFDDTFDVSAGQEDWNTASIGIVIRKVN